VNKEIILQNPDQSITNSLSTGRREEIEENRRHVYYLAMALLYLSRQGLAIRGHDESGLSSKRGNLIELLELYAALDKLTRRYGHYTWPEYQNDIIHCLAQQLQLKTVQNVK